MTHANLKNQDLQLNGFSWISVFHNQKFEKEIIDEKNV